MTQKEHHKKPGDTLWGIANDLRSAMNATISAITCARFCCYATRRTTSCLSAVDALITAQTEKIEQLQQHKKGLMQGLFP